MIERDKRLLTSMINGIFVIVISTVLDGVQLIRWDCSDGRYTNRRCSSIIPRNRLIRLRQDPVRFRSPEFVTTCMEREYLQLLPSDLWPQKETEGF